MVSRRDFIGLCAAAPAFASPDRPAAAARQRPAPPAWPSTFPALRESVNGRRLVYLDSAATTLRPQSVIDALVRYYSTDNANPSRVHTLASRAADRLAGARQTVARFINAADPLEVIFVRGTTEGVNLVAGTWAKQNVRPGDEVLLSVAEHASNLMPWARVAQECGAAVRVAPVTDDGRLDVDQVKKLLSKRTRVVALSHVSNVLGYVNPITEICALARDAGATTVIDGAQGAPHVAVDVRAIGCDFYIFSGHKMLGPMGTGVVWGRRALLDAMPPYHVGSNMAHAVEFEHAEYEPAAQKFQAGTPDVAGPVGLAAAVEFFERAGHDAVARHDRLLVEHGLARLAEVPRLRLLGPRTADRRVPVFAFVIDGRPAADVARACDRRGIAVRAGDMAALPLLKRFATTEAVRASAYLYSTPADLDALAEALQQMA